MLIAARMRLGTVGLPEGQVAVKTSHCAARCWRRRSGLTPVRSRFQVGMFAWMAARCFVLFSAPNLTPFESQYWLMTQIARVCGFATSYPANWWLIHIGVKEAM